MFFVNRCFKIESLVFLFPRTLVHLCNLDKIKLHCGSVLNYHKLVETFYRPERRVRTLPIGGACGSTELHVDNQHIKHLGQGH